MRRWIQQAASLYPRRWRDRYRVEFEALLEDVEPGWRDLLDVARGALWMQATNPGAYWRLGAIAAIAGGVIALASSFVAPSDYVSSAVVRIGANHAPHVYTATAEAGDSIHERFARVVPSIVSRTSLQAILSGRYMNLYLEDRQRVPMEELIQRMRDHLNIGVVEIPSAGASGPLLELTISFRDHDKYAAQKVVSAIASRTQELNHTVNGIQAFGWKAVWPQAPAPPGDWVQICRHASLPTDGLTPNRWRFLAFGLAGGLTLGWLSVLAARRPKWTGQMAGFALLGLVMALALSRIEPVHYTSAAVLQVTPAYVAADPAATTSATPVDRWLARLQPAAVNDQVLADIVRATNLYSDERARIPMPEIVDMMRRDLTISARSPVRGARNQSEFQIAFTDTDRYRAQHVVSELVNRVVDRNELDTRAAVVNAQDAWAIREIQSRRLGENLDLLDAPSLPESPASADPWSRLPGGVLVGLLLGGLALQERDPHGSTLKPA